MTDLTKGAVLRSFEELEVGLRNWSSFGGPGEHDPVGMMALFCACVANLRTNVAPDRWTDLGEILDEDERAFLRVIADAK